MPLTIKAPRGLVPNGEAAIYTAPVAPEKGAFLNGRFVNVSAGAATLELYAKAPAGTKRALDEIQTIAAGKFYAFPKGVALEAGEELRANSDTASAIEFTFNVIQVS